MAREAIRPGQVYWNAGKRAWAVVWEVGEFGAVRLCRIQQHPTINALRLLAWSGDVPAGWTLYREAP